MKRRTVTLVIFLLLSSLAFVSTRPASSFTEVSPATEPQRAGQAGRRARPRPRPAAKPQVDYSKFSHNRPEHSEQPNADPKLARTCATCHTIPALNLSVASNAYDIKDYPKHESCLGCHRQQFFKGARPAICANCHTVVSPRGDVRFPFPKTAERADSDFALNYPHKNHVKSTMLIQFKTAFGASSNTQATCTYCHKVDETNYKPPKGLAADDKFPSKGTFMTRPNGHATCFQCHWREDVENRKQPPLATQCAECHKPNAAHVAATATPAATATTPASTATTPATVKPTPASAKPTPASAKPTPAASGSGAAKPTPTPIVAHATAQKPAPKPKPAPTPKPAAPAPTPVVAHNVPAPWTLRVVERFPHEIDNHKKRKDDNKEVAITCSQCHKAVKDAKTLEFLREEKNRVQLFPSCTSSACHTPTSKSSAVWPKSLSRELQGRGDDNSFKCATCHLSPRSEAKTPCTHYAAYYAQIYEDVKARLKKNAKPEETPEEFAKRLAAEIEKRTDIQNIKAWAEKSACGAQDLNKWVKP